ncbi:hypothetical protein DL771_007977 [Monosporascus sp. 5C6A]|nr:hypothetical protein DL771_007977 [Monosporascus sp. 5C6A]
MRDGRPNTEFTPESDATSGSSPGPSPNQHAFTFVAGPQIRYPEERSGGRPGWVPGGRGRSHAARACEKCRLSKRKCDKTLPYCDRCLRLNAKCHYTPDPAPANLDPNASPMVIHQPGDLILGHADLLGAITVSHILSLIEVPKSFQGESKLHWRPSVHTYFTYVHPWFTVVNPVLFDRQIAELSPTQDPPPTVDSQLSPISSGNGDHPMSIEKPVSEYRHKQLALLIVAMHLITRMRRTETGPRPMFDETYRAVKRLLALMFMAYGPNQQPSIELAQCGALMSLYEYGHGQTVTAYRTLAETTAAARILGVRPPGFEDPGAKTGAYGLRIDRAPSENTTLSAGFHYEYDQDESLSRMEKELRGSLWWGLFILDQFIHKDDSANHLPFLLEAPTDTALLPETPPTTSLESQPRHPISVAVGSTALTPFQLSAKTSSLLHRALQIDKERDPRPDKRPLINTFADLDGEIRQTSKALLEKIPRWETVLDCFSVLISALFTLYLPYLPIIEQTAPAALEADLELSTAVAALKFACRLSTDISCRVNQDLVGTGTATRKEDDPFAVLAAPAGSTCYHVIIAFAGLSRIYPDERERCAEAIAEKFESLHLFSYRWGLADEMIRQLEEERGISRSDYLKTPRLPSPQPPQSDENEGMILDSNMSLSF